MQNSNLIHIMLDMEKKRKRQELARLYSQVTELCRQKKITWKGDLATEIKIGRHSFPCNENGLRRARNFVLNLEQKELEMI